MRRQQEATISRRTNHCTVATQGKGGKLPKNLFEDRYGFNQTDEPDTFLHSIQGGSDQTKHKDTALTNIDQDRHCKYDKACNGQQLCEELKPDYRPQ